MHYYFKIKHKFSQSRIYNFKSEIKFWKIYNGVIMIIVMIVIVGLLYNSFFLNLITDLR
jgi:hypothetical protein